MPSTPTEIVVTSQTSLPLEFGARDFRIYGRNPGPAWADPTLRDGYAASPPLPPDAVDSGYRYERRSLWMVPGDDAAIYLVEAGQGTGERWPREAEPPGCF